MTEDDSEGAPSWGWYAVQYLFWGTLVVLLYPFLALLRADERIEYADDLYAADPNLFD